MFNSVPPEVWEQVAEITSFARHGESRFKYPGPVAWCKRCSRTHPRRACNLVQDERIAKSGRTVIRWVHPEFKTKPKKKTRARKS